MFANVDVPSPLSHQAKCNSYLKNQHELICACSKFKNQINQHDEQVLALGLSRLCLAYSRRPRPTDAMPTFAIRKIISFAWVSYCAARVGRGYGGAVTASEPLAASFFQSLFCRRSLSRASLPAHFADDRIASRKPTSAFAFSLFTLNLEHCIA